MTDAADDGWFAYNYPPYGADGMHAHATRDADGRWVLNALFLHGEALSAETLRGISIPRMEAKLALDTQDPDTRERMSRSDDDALTIGELRKRSKLVADEQREQLESGVERRRQLTRPDGVDPDEFYRGGGQRIRRVRRAEQRPGQADRRRGRRAGRHGAPVDPRGAPSRVPAAGAEGPGG